MNRVADTLYASYIKERQNGQILENEVGFLAYKYNGEDCFIIEAFVEKHSRGQHNIGSLIDTLRDIAVFEGCKTMSATIYVADQGANRTLRAAMKLGFKIARAENGIILIVKEIGG